MNREYDCMDVNFPIQGILDGTNLVPDEESLFKRHLSQCSECRRLYSAMLFDQLSPPVSPVTTKSHRPQMRILKDVLRVIRSFTASIDIAVYFGEVS